jgi:hypothetical protein
MADRKWFKGKAALAIDRWYSSDDVRANLEYARSLLERRTLSFDAIVRELDAAGRKENEFVYPLGGGALQGDDFESVTRQGYLEAIGLALESDAHGPVPIKTFWMTGAGNEQFEMHIADGAEHVSVTLLVPETEGGSYYEGDPESWVVRIGADGEPDAEPTSGPRNRQRPSLRRPPEAS